MKKIVIVISFLILVAQGIFAQLADSLAYNTYYEDEIFNDKYLQIYNSWSLKAISGGITGNGYKADYDLLKIDSIGIFRIYRNDSLFIYGKINVLAQDDNNLFISLVADTVSEGISFYDMQKYVLLDSSSLTLQAPCCDRYNYHFSIQASESTVTNITDDAKEFIHIYPDPTCGILTLEFENPVTGTLEVRNLNGQLLSEIPIRSATGQIDMGSFSKGIYLITIRSEEFLRTEKIVKL